MDENKRKLKHRIFVYTFWLVCGLILLTLSILGVVEGEFFIPFSVVWSALSLVRIVRYGRLMKHDTQRAEYFLFQNDERNLMIKHRAISITSYIYIFISLCAIIALEILGYYEISAAIVCTICVFVTMYTVVVFILRKMN